MKKRIVSKITHNPFNQGFLGAGHTASAVLEGTTYQESDPFILFMDDRLDLPGGDPVGGAHPHAGFETLTLILKGNGREWETGSFELMTAGKGIVHTEEITAEQNVHILQVWMALPPDKRWAEPFWQNILLEDVPTIKNENYEVRVYSGKSNGLTSPLKNYTPLTLVDFSVKKEQIVVQELPDYYSGLIYVLSGAVQVGDKTILSGQAGWLEQIDGEQESEIDFLSLDDETRFVLYAAQPHNVPVVSHGPFIGDSMEDIRRLYREYRNGEMPHLEELPESQKSKFSLQD
jgi:redox-sensitive bicupin YhaK (pirin superfamily)